MIRQLGAAFLLGVALAAVVAGPAMGRLASEVLGYENDDLLNAIYLHDMVHRALGEGRLPVVDPNQFVPVGFPFFAAAGGNVLEMLVSGLFRLFAPFPLWYALGALAWIPLNLAAFQPLGVRLWGPGIVPLVAGAAWAMQPVLLGEMAAGRLTQVALAGLPLAVAGLVAIAEGQRGVMLAGVGAALTAWGYWYAAIFLAILGPLFVAWGLWTSGRRCLAPFARAVALAAILALPLALPALWPRLTGGWSAAPPLDPARMSPVFDNALQLARSQPRQLVGWLTWSLVPGFVGCAMFGRRRALWLGCAAACLVFALGPGQYLGGRNWLLPYWPLWRWLPFLGRLTHPGRWLDFGVLFLVIVSVEGLVSRWRPGRWLAVAAAAGVVAQVLAAGQAPLSTFQLREPKLWKEARSVGKGLIVVPVLQSGRTTWTQAFHGRPLLGGMLEDAPWAWPPAFRSFVEKSPLIMSLYGLGGKSPGAVEVWQSDLDALHGAGLGGVVFSTQSWTRIPRGAAQAAISRITDALGDPRYADREGAVWALPYDGRPGEAPSPQGSLPPP